MKQIIWISAVLVALLVVISETECRSLTKRSASPSIDSHGSDEHNGYKDKAKVEVVFGVKDAILGFVFDKLNKFIDQKTHWVDQLDHQNIAKNKAHGIEPPTDPVISLSQILSGAIGSKLEAAAPLLNIVTSKLGSGSGSGGSNHGGFNFGALLGGHK